MKLKYIALMCMLIAGQDRLIQAGTLSGQETEQIAQTIVQAAVATGVIGYAIVQYGYGAVITAGHWLKARGQEKRLRKEAEHRALEQEAKRKSDLAYAQMCAKNEQQKQAKFEADRAVQHKACSQKVAHILSTQKADLKVCCEYYQELITQESYLSEDVSQQYIARRYEALHAYLSGNDVWQEKTYQLSTPVVSLLKDQSIAFDEYKLLYGNQIQQALHTEYVGILEATATFILEGTDNRTERKSIAATLTRFAHAGQVHNRAGYINQSLLFADYCQGVLDIRNEIFDVSIDVALATGKGAWSGAGNLWYKLIYPKRTAIEFTRSIVQLVKITARISENMDSFILNSKRLARLKQEQDDRDIASGKYTKEDIEKRDNAQFDALYAKTVKDVRQTLVTTWQRLDYQSTLIALEKASEIGTEGLLTNVGLKALSSLVGNGTNALSSIIEEGGGFNDYLNMPFNGTTFEAVVSYEMVVAQEAAQAVRVAGSAVAQIIDDSAKLMPIGSLKGPPDRSKNIPSTDVLIDDILSITSKVSESQYSVLIAQYDGTRFINGKAIKFPYKHIWEGEVARSGRKLGGFHHDYLDFCLNKGLLREVHMFEGEFYTAEVYYNGQWIRKSFFPKKWRHEDVMHCVIDVLDKNPLPTYEGHYAIFEGDAGYGVNIKVVIDSLTGECKTCYPNLIGKL